MYVICRPIFVVQNSCAVHPGWTIHRVHDYYHCGRPCQVCRCGEETAIKHVEKLRIKDSYEVCPIMQHGAATCSKLGVPGCPSRYTQISYYFRFMPHLFPLVFCRKVWWYLNRQQNFTVQVKCSTWLERRRMHFYSARNARIASAVWATAIPSVCLSVCPSVCHTPVLCQNDGT